MFDELAAQIIANIAVIFVAAPIPEEILRADIFVDASEIFTLYFGFVSLPIEPAVLILMIVSVILA